MGVNVGVDVNVGVMVGVAVRVGVRVTVGVRVGVGVMVAVAVGVGEGPPGVVTTAQAENSDVAPFEDVAVAVMIWPIEGLMLTEKLMEPLDSVVTTREPK